MKKILMACLGSMFILTAFAANKGDPIKEGVDYTILATPVQATSEPKGVVNVKEFFSFTCIHCKLTEPLIEQMLVPDKRIDLNKIQVLWGNNPILNGYAKLSATIQRARLSKLYLPAFNVIFSQTDMNNPDKAHDLNNQETLKAFLAQNGLNTTDINNFISVYNSFTIAAKVAEYKTLTSSYNITGTPTFVVADKYVVTPAQPPRSIEVVQYLVNKVNKN